MSKIGQVIFLFLWAGSSYAQPNYFVLIKADNNQPFYARIGERSFSSSMQGHLIIPQLRDSTYLMTIGFPKKLFPEQDFSFTIKKNDLEFQLKDLGEKGWGLFNPHTMELKMPVRIDTGGTKFRAEGVKKDDAFSRLMSGVVSDTAVMYITYAPESPARGDSAREAASTPPQPPLPAGSNPQGSLPLNSNTQGTPPTQIPGSQNTVSQNTVSQTPILQTHVTTPPIADSTLRANQQAPNTGTKADSAAIRPAGAGNTAGSATPVRTADFVPKAANRHKKDYIEKLTEEKTAANLWLTYADHATGRKTDTILILIPVDSASQPISPSASVPATGSLPNLGSVPNTGSPGAPGSSQNTASLPNTSYTTSSAPGSRTVSDKQVDTTRTAKTTPDPGQKPKKAPPVVVNSDCKNFAADYDVDKLRLKLLATPKDEDKVLIANKVFKTRCFSSRQIKALCEVFTGDPGKYRFLEAAYPFVYDEHFRELTDILTDPSYISRFRKMTGQ